MTGICCHEWLMKRAKTKFDIKYLRSIQCYVTFFLSFGLVNKFWWDGWGKQDLKTGNNIGNLYKILLLISSQNIFIGAHAGKKKVNFKMEGFLKEREPSL